jgi:hypothetical protein
MNHRKDTKDKQCIFTKKFVAMTKLGQDVYVMLRDALDTRFFRPRYGRNAWGYRATIEDASYMMDAALYLVPGGRTLWHVTKLVHVFGGSDGRWR